MSVRVGFVGKGGAGKSVVAGTVCRALARQGIAVLALDVDTMPGLAVALGGPPIEARLPAGLAAREDGQAWQMKRGVRPSRLVDRDAARGPDGVRFLELGKLPGRVEPSVSVAFRYVLEGFRRPGWAIVADLAAGTRQPMFGWAGSTGRVLVVVDPSTASILTARRLLAVSTHLVANKVRDAADVARVREAVPLPLLAAIPYDERLATAEQSGLAPIDAAPEGPAVRAIAELARRLKEEEPR
jgi:CO dehydrogenase maturation factor